MSGAGERRGTNGHVPDPTEAAVPADEAALDALDAEPLDALEAAAGEAAAADEVDESLDERVGAVIDELGVVDRRRVGTAEEFAVGGASFATVDADHLEAALDRAEAWVRLAHRRASGR